MGSKRPLPDLRPEIAPFVRAGLSGRTMRIGVDLMPRRTSATPARAFSRCHGASFVHHHCSPHQILAVATVDRPLRRGVVLDLDEPEPPRLSGKTVAHHRDCVDRHSLAGEKILDVRLIRRVRQVSYKELL